jgi:hypothetical protein
MVCVYVCHYQSQKEKNKKSGSQESPVFLGHVVYCISRARCGKGQEEDHCTDQPLSMVRRSAREVSVQSAVVISRYVRMDDNGLRVEQGEMS